MSDARTILMGMEPTDQEVLALFDAMLLRVAFDVDVIALEAVFELGNGLRVVEQLDCYAVNN